MMGYLLASLIGLSLGLLGGGGSILTLPILVYVLEMPTKLSIALSLGIVGVTSLFGTINHLRNRNINFSAALWVGPFAAFGTLVGTKLSLLFPAEVQLLLFGFIMMMASFSLLRSKDKDNVEENSEDSIKINKRTFLLSIQGFLIGVITGIVGVGGGFLIVPVLVIFARVGIRKAIGTSLLLITVNSLIGFIGYLNEFTIPWDFFIKFSLFSIGGVLIGSFSAKFVSQKLLKKFFAFFLLLMGIFILYQNMYIVTKP